MSFIELLLARCAGVIFGLGIAPVLLTWIDEIAEHEEKTHD